MEKKITFASPKPPFIVNAIPIKKKKVPIEILLPWQNDSKDHADDQNQEVKKILDLT